MTGPLAIAVGAAALVVALWALVAAIRDRPTGTTHLAGLAVVELGLLAQVVVAVVLMAQGHRALGGTAIFVVYLVGSLVVLPVGAVWGLAERSRWGSVVVVVACVTIPLVIARMNQVWHGTGP